MKIDPTKTVDQEFQELRGSGHTGGINDMITQFLISQGNTGGVGDVLYQNSLVQTAPVNVSAPVIFGGQELGDTLTVSNGSWTGGGLTYTYQWRANGVNISGQTSNTYTIVAGNASQTITCLVTATNDVDTANQISNSVVLDDLAPVNTVLPTISGNTTEGSVLSVENGTWTGGQLVFTYQWQADAVNISGATGSTYTLLSGDSLDAITCIVTATNAISGVSATSNTITAGDFTSDTTAPTLSSTSWNDTTGLGSVTSDEAGTLYLATYNTASGTPTPNGSGGWAGTTLETFSQAVSSGANSLSFAETSASSTATHFTYYVRDAAGNDSSPVIQAYTHDITGPSPSGFTPADNAADVAIDSNLVISFGETIVEGTGNLYIYDDGPTLLETIAIGSTTVGSTSITINPTSDFSNSANINVQWDAGIVEDQRGNPIAANADSTVFNFTTVAGGGGGGFVAPSYSDTATFGAGTVNPDVADTGSTISVDTGTGGGVLMQVASFGDNGLSSITIGGVSATRTFLDESQSGRTFEVWTASSVPSGAQNLVATSLSGESYSAMISVYSGGVDWSIRSSVFSFEFGGDPTADINVTAGDAGYAMSIFGVEDGGGTARGATGPRCAQLNGTGPTDFDAYQDFFGLGIDINTFSATGLSAATPQTFTISDPAGSTNNFETYGAFTVVGPSA